MPYYFRHNQKTSNGGTITNTTGNGAGYITLNTTITPGGVGGVLATGGGAGLFDDLITDLQMLGAFTLIPGTGTDNSVTNGTTGRTRPRGSSADFAGHEFWILECTNSDPLFTPIGTPAPGFSANQNWRIALNRDTGELFWGTVNQINEANEGSATDDVVDVNTPSLNLFVDLRLLGRGPDPITGVPYRFDYKYEIVTTDRGVALSVYPSLKENDAYFHRSIVMQRPTNPVTGDIKQTEQAPVFVVHSQLVSALGGTEADYNSTDIEVAMSEQNLGLNGINVQKPLPSDLYPENGSDPSTIGEWIPGFKFGTVRDASIPASNPTTTSMLTKNDTLLYPFVWQWQQPPMLDNYNHVIKFPFGMGLAGRFIYLDEMDMFGLVHGASFGFGQEATIDLYTPAQTRTYKANVGHVAYRPNRFEIGTTNRPGNQGRQEDYWSRIVFLKDGPSVLV